MEIPFYRNYVDEAEAEAVSAVARRGMHWAIGPEIAEFEQRCAELLQVKHAVAFSSGTAVGHALMHALGVAGGEVIVPSGRRRLPRLGMSQGVKREVSEIKKAALRLKYGPRKAIDQG